MTTSLDGEPVVAGDSVYDMVWGPGSVLTVQMSGNFVVRFAGTRTGTYTPAGVNTRYPGRTLYWRNPVIVVPTKDEGRWTLIHQLVSGIVQSVRNWSGA